MSEISPQELITVCIKKKCMARVLLVLLNYEPKIESNRFPISKLFFAHFFDMVAIEGTLIKAYILQYIIINFFLFAQHPTHVC